MRFKGKTVLAIHEGQTDTAMVPGPQVTKCATLRLSRALLTAEGIAECPFPKQCMAFGFSVTAG